ncbi:MAG: SpoIIE family protein phosphatase [Planctomycetota bacterium]|nr:SpoIIE family protein phosphatase [Planctomycetota bacterium]
MARSSRSRKRAAKKVKFGLPMKITVGSVIVVVIVEAGLFFAFGAPSTNWGIVAPLLVLLVGLAGIFSYMFSLSITKPLKQVIKDISALADGNYKIRTRVRSDDEVGVLAQSVNELAESLESAEHSVQAVEEEMNLASEIQTMLLPDRNPKIPTLDIYPFYEPAGELGGDYYDFIPVSPEHLGIIIADVSGKGITGSMVMGLFRNTLRRFAEGNTSTSEVLIKTNEHLSKDIPRGMFVTAYYVLYHIPTNEITFSCAGHTKMVLYRATSGSIELVKPNGMALGFDTGMVFNRSIQEPKMKLRTGDRIVLYTDGVIEAVNRRGDMFGENRLFRFVKDYSDLSSKEFLMELREELDEFRSGAEPNDDVTLVTLEVLEK